VFGCGPMSVSGKLVLFRGSPVDLVHSGRSSGGNVAALWNSRDRLGSRSRSWLPKTATIRGEATGYPGRAGISPRRAAS
jgi:hypothetical protein